MMVVDRFFSSRKPRFTKQTLTPKQRGCSQKLLPFFVVLEKATVYKDENLKNRVLCRDGESTDHEYTHGPASHSWCDWHRNRRSRCCRVGDLSLLFQAKT